MNNIDFFQVFRISREEYLSSCGTFEIFHNDISDGNYAIIEETVKVVIEISSVIFLRDLTLVISDYKNREISRKKAKTQIIPCEKYSKFEFSIDTAEIGVGLFFLHLEIDSLFKIYGCRCIDKLYFSDKIPQDDEKFQITVTKKSDEKNICVKGIIYHIFVDRFHRGGEITPKEDAIMIDNWSSDIPEIPEYPGAFLKNNTFFGGTLIGIAKKLDYLKQLGVSLIYLSPIFESPSNHKYDTSDYMKVDIMFGGEKGLKTLIEESKKRDIGIILDGVFNHTGADSIYFNKFSRYKNIGAYQSTDSKFYNWYTFTSHPNKYVSWWGIDILPRINYENSDAENFFLGENGVIEKWMSLGIKGFRLDVADELSNRFIERMRTVMKKIDSSSLLYGEVWEDASNKIAYGKRRKYYLGNQLDGVMNYPLRKGIINYIVNKSEADLNYALSVVLLNIPAEIRKSTMNLLGTHDTVRILTTLANKDVSQKSNAELSMTRLNKNERVLAKRRLKSAYTILSALPGIPTVYYGDEAGIEGYSDPLNRRTFPWGNEDTEILAHYIKNGKIRFSEAALYDGSFSLLHIDTNLLVFERKKDEERIILAYNNNKNRSLEIVFSSEGYDLLFERKDTRFNLEPESAKLLKFSCKCKILF